MDQRRIHLPIAINFHDNVHIIFYSDFIACHDSATDTLIHSALNNSDSWVGTVAINVCSRRFGATIINYINPINLRRHFVNDIQNVFFYTKARNDYCNFMF